MTLSVDQMDFIKLIQYSVFKKTGGILDILHFAEIDAAFESARYYQQNMLKAASFNNDLDQLAFALNHVEAEGLYLEFGVASGRTINHIAGLKNNKKIYGFDVFSGLPETWRTGFEKGTFSMVEPPPVRDNCELIVGLYEDTLPQFIKNQNSNIAFIHVDCDLYSSTRTIFENCGQYLKPGSVICFDEYFNYPGWQQHEFLAWKQFCNQYDISYEYLGFVNNHQQVSIRII